MKNKVKRSGVILWLSILVLVSGLIFTEGVDAKTKVNIQAEKSRYLKKQGMYIIEGNPFIKYKDYTISADLIRYYEDEDRAIFIGNVVVLQNDTRILADEMEAELKDESFIMDGNVDIYYVRKKKEETKENSVEAERAVTEDTEVIEGQEEVAVEQDQDEAAAKDEKTEKDDIIKIRAQHVEFTQVNDADYLVANTDVTMEVDDQIIQSTYLEYKGDEEVVIAREKVQVTGADEEELSTDEFTYWLEGEEEGFQAEGGVKLEFYMDEDDEEESDAEKAVSKEQKEPVEDATVEADSTDEVQESETDEELTVEAIDEPVTEKSDQ